MADKLAGVAQVVEQYVAGRPRRDYAVNYVYAQSIIVAKDAPKTLLQQSMQTVVGGRASLPLFAVPVASYETVVGSDAPQVRVTELYEFVVAGADPIPEKVWLTRAVQTAQVIIGRLPAAGWAQMHMVVLGAVQNEATRIKLIAYGLSHSALRKAPPLPPIQSYRSPRTVLSAVEQVLTAKPVPLPHSRTRALAVTHKTLSKRPATLPRSKSRAVQLIAASLSRSPFPAPASMHQPARVQQASMQVLRKQGSYRDPSTLRSPAQVAGYAELVLKSLTHVYTPISEIRVMGAAQKTLSADTALYGMLWSFERVVSYAQKALSGANYLTPKKTHSNTGLVFVAHKVLAQHPVPMPHSIDRVQTLASLVLAKDTSFGKPGTEGVTAKVVDVAARVLSRAPALPAPGTLRTPASLRGAYAPLLSAYPMAAPGKYRSKARVTSMALRWLSKDTGFPPPNTVVDPRKSRATLALARLSIQKSKAGFPPPSDITNTKYRVVLAAEQVATVSTYPDPSVPVSSAAVEQLVQVLAVPASYPNPAECVVYQSNLVFEALAENWVGFPDKDTPQSIAEVSQVVMFGAAITAYPDKNFNWAWAQVSSVAGIVAQKGSYPDKDMPQSIAQVNSIRQTRVQVAQPYPDKNLPMSLAEVDVLVQAFGFPASGYPDKDVPQSKAQVAKLAPAVANPAVYEDKNAAHSSATVSGMSEVVASSAAYRSAYQPLSDAVVSGVMLVSVQQVEDYGVVPRMERHRSVITIDYL
ncbi:hypothetical protein WK13_34930 [Burkholderia ubonensis]|uniref:hypothetical protein n=1 Tax=Burkholderia ubonensis TaxID=101571 RepID=UPI0007540D7E|nr:hypothetical protein [Burkholderia ubonensis]KVR21736.1 hypothetical protein WK13_34930 [Burkholderia ubonensis]